MGFWNKLGQIALQAAPYVAAPFTGGMSLMAAPMTGGLANKLEDRSDQQEFLKTGVAPSRSGLNKIMGGVNAAAGMYGGAKLGGKLLGGNNPVMGNDLPSQGGITGNMGGQNGLTGFLKNLGGNQGFDIISNLRQPNQQAMNSPYADPRDAPRPSRFRQVIQQGRNRAHAY